MIAIIMKVAMSQVSILRIKLMSNKTKLKLEITALLAPFWKINNNFNLKVVLEAAGMMLHRIAQACQL